MNSIPKFLAGAKRLVVGVATADNRRGGARPGDAFKALLDKAGPAPAVRPGRHVALPHRPALAAEAALEGRPTAAPLRDGKGGLAAEKVPGEHRSVHAKQDQEPGADAIVGQPLVQPVAAASVVPVSLTAEEPAPQPPPESGDCPKTGDEPPAHADQDRVSDSQSDLLAHRRSESAKAEAPNPHWAQKAEQPAPQAPQSPQAAPVAERPPVDAIRVAQQVVAIGTGEGTESIFAVGALPQASLLQYRTHLASSPPRFTQSGGSQRDRLMAEADPIGQSEPAREAPRPTLTSAPHVVGRGSAEPQPQPGPGTDAAAASAESNAAPLGLPQPVLEAIRDSVTGAALELASGVAPEAGPVTHSSDSVAPARHLEVAVDLLDYGIVNLRVTLSGQALTLRMTAERADTAHRLHREREALGAVLAKAGFDADILPVDSVSPSAPAAGSVDAFAQLGGGTSFSDAGSRRADPNRPRPRGTPFVEQSNGDETGTAGDRRAGALYV